MRGESYTLQEVAELLGVSKRTLQRRIREGAFPGRFLSPGPHGLETRIPASDVRRALDDARDVADSGRSLMTRAEVAPLNHTGHQPGSGLSASDLEAVRDAVLAITRSDREGLLAAVHDAVVARDRELVALRGQVSVLQGSMDRLRRRIEAWMDEQQAPIPPALEAAPARAPAMDLGQVLLDDIEQMLSQLTRAK
jgi:excisionase family DNA binding protein